jgi:hypothetical protein
VVDEMMAHWLLPDWRRTVAAVKSAGAPGRQGEASCAGRGFTADSEV